MNSDELAGRILKELFGSEVERLSVSTESGKKTPDFFIKYGAATALVEAKLKNNNPKDIDRRTETLQAGDIYESCHALGRNETISGIVHRGTQQLKANTVIEAKFRILLFMMNCINPEAVRDQLIDTLYGKTQVIEMKTSCVKPCYFYRNSDFYRRKELDAVISSMCGDENISPSIIYINTYSSRYQELKESELLRPFGSNVLDPIEEEKMGRAYIPDDDIERTEDKFMQQFTQHFPALDPVLHHLAKKYKTGALTRCDFKAPEFSILTDD